MSIDYYVYGKNMESFSIKKCEEYLLTLGLKAEIYPEFDVRSHTGFLPFKLNGGFIFDNLVEQDFKSGYEIQLNPYTYTPPKNESKVLLGRLFKKKNEQKETPFHLAVKDATHYFFINCSSQDSFEILLAYAFAAYLCKNYGAILDDPQSGQFFDREKLVTIEVNVIVDELKTMYQDGQLLTHEFIEW